MNQLLVLSLLVISACWSPTLAQTLSHQDEVALGMRDFDGQTFESAQWHFSNAIKSKPDDANSYVMRAECYASCGQPRKALADYAKAISLNPKSSLYHSMRARIYDSMYEDKLAQADDEEAVRLDPDDTVAISNVAMRRLKAGKIDEAKKLFTKAIDLEPSYTGYYQLAEIARDEGNYKLADEYMEKSRDVVAHGMIGRPGDPINIHHNTPVVDFPPKIHHLGHRPIFYKTVGEREREKQAKIEKGARIHHSFSSSGPKQSKLPASGIHNDQPSTGQ
jgi:Tfp pilus assembly protein PilF